MPSHLLLDVDIIDRDVGKGLAVVHTELGMNVFQLVYRSKAVVSADLVGCLPR